MVFLFLMDRNERECRIIANNCYFSMCVISSRKPVSSFFIDLCNQTFIDSENPFDITSWQLITYINNSCHSQGLWKQGVSRHRHFLRALKKAPAIDFSRTDKFCYSYEASLSLFLDKYFIQNQVSTFDLITKLVAILLDI